MICPRCSHEIDDPGFLQGLVIGIVLGLLVALSLVQPAASIARLP